MIGPLLDDPDSPWVQIDLAAQPREWAAGTVSRRWAAQRLNPDPHRAEVITGSIARIVGALDAAALDAALLRYPAGTAVPGCGGDPRARRLRLAGH